MSIQTSDADLRAAQTTINVLTIANTPSDTTVDSYTFSNCTFLNAAGTSSHPVRVAYGVTFFCDGSINGGYTSYFSGNPTTVANQVNPFGGITGPLETTTQQVSGKATNAIAATDSTAWACTSNITVVQTTPLSIGWSFGASTGNGSTGTITANNVTSFTLSPVTGEPGGNTITLSATAATSADISAFLGDVGEYAPDSYDFELTSCTGLTAASSINIAGGTHTYNLGASPDTVTNALLAAYVAGGGISGTLIIGGGSASPTGTGITDKATLISNGVSVTTN